MKTVKTMKTVLLPQFLIINSNLKAIVCIKKRLVFEIQISHNYSDMIVLNCVELMIRDKNVSYLQEKSIGHVP